MLHLLSPSLSTHFSHVNMTLVSGRKLERNDVTYGWQIPSKNMLWRFGLNSPPIGQKSVGYSVVTVNPSSTDCGALAGFRFGLAILAFSFDSMEFHVLASHGLKHEFQCNFRVSHASL
jgi:hypothetical protein